MYDLSAHSLASELNDVKRDNKFCSILRIGLF